MKNIGVFGLFVTMLALSAVGCADKKPAETPVSQASVTSAPVMKKASATVAVDEDIARACKLQVHDLDTAPKFDFDKTDLHPTDRELLTKVAACLTTGPLKGRSISLIGRTDPRGEPQYNMSLGADRANSVGSFLTNLGMVQSHVQLTSRGELDAVGIDEDGWQTDRRVDIVLVKK